MGVEVFGKIKVCFLITPVGLLVIQAAFQNVNAIFGHSAKCIPNRIAAVGILENMAVCQRLGYTLLIDDKGGHRLDKNSLRKIRDEIFNTDF